MLEWRQVVLILSTMYNSYDVIEIESFVVLNTCTLQNFHLREYSILMHQFGLKHAKPNIGKIFKDQYYFDYKISSS